MNTNTSNTMKANATHFEGTVMRAAGKLMLFMGVGLSGMIIVPTLSILSFVFGVVGFAVLAVPFVNLLGFASIPYFVMGFMVTGLPQILVGVITGVMLMLAGCLSGYGLKKYFQGVKYLFGNRGVQ